MTLNRLAQLIEKPETHRAILRGYEGPYALGVTRHPQNKGELALRLRVEGNPTADFPDQVILEGEPVLVLVEPGFEAPLPLKV